MEVKAELDNLSASVLLCLLYIVELLLIIKLALTDSAVVTVVVIRKLEYFVFF